jgi:hypothetical protein
VFVRRSPSADNSNAHVQLWFIVPRFRCRGARTHACRVRTRANAKENENAAGDS